MFRFAFHLSVSLTAILAVAAQAQAGDHGQDHFHGENRETIVVTAPGLSELDILAGRSVVEGEELQRNMDGQIGEVLARLPGVSASSFAPGVSRPILRGFGGERVRMLTDGVGAIDASSTSDDHAVTVEPLIADRIEVLRGPAVLLYGSQAIGGAVNVVTKRIPPRVPDEPIHVDALVAGDTASNRYEGGLSVDVPLAGNVAVHFDGSYRNTDNLEIAGFAASKDLRRRLLADAAEEAAEGHDEEAAELREGAAQKGNLPNSWVETYTIGAGIAFFSGESNLGISYDYYDTAYGIPGLPGAGHVHGDDDHGEQHGDEGEAVSIGMKRHRASLRGVLDLGDGLFDSIQTRLGYSSYTHTEFEGDEIGTVFDVEGIEGRVELVQSRRGGWQGSIGGQYSHVDFDAQGEEAFVPGNRTESFALFAVQEFDLSRFHLEIGGRYEHSAIDAARSIGRKRTFDMFSASGGLSYALREGPSDDLRIGLNLSRAERAPSAQELFADGPHVATQQFEIGNPALGKEASWGLEGYVRGAIGAVDVSASIYRNWFDGFIYLVETGAEEDGLEVFRFMQGDARQFGVEGQVTFPIHTGDNLSLGADLRADYVRASLGGGGTVPRIPPLSLLGALEAQFGRFDARGEVQWFDAQKRVSEHETPTKAFTFVNLALTWHPPSKDGDLSVMLQAENIFDTVGRRHASFTKDFVPLAGRNVKVSMRASF